MDDAYFDALVNSWDDTFVETLSQRWPHLDPLVLHEAFERMKEELDGA